MSASTSGSGPFWRRRGARNGPGNRGEREDAASQISAYVYGSILVLAALVALEPPALEGPRGFAYVLGTALSTFVAHVVAGTVAFRVRADRPPVAGDVRHEIRNAVPIATSALWPCMFMAAVLLGWLDPTPGLQLAIGVTLVRVAAFGWIVGYMAGERAHLRTFIAGIVLALLCLAVAVLKWWLTS